MKNWLVLALMLRVWWDCGYGKENYCDGVVVGYVYSHAAGKLTSNTKAVVKLDDGKMAEASLSDIVDSAWEDVKATPLPAK